MLRLGSAWYDVATQIKAVTEEGIDPRNFILCTDDCHSGTLVHEGHMDRVVRHAIAQGLKPVTAIQMATPQHRPAFRAGARDRLDRAGAARRFPDRLRPAGAGHRRGLWPRRQAGEGRQARGRHPRLRLSGARQEDDEARQEAEGQGFRHRLAEGRQRGARAGDRRHREPGADARAGSRSRGRERAGGDGPPQRRLPDRAGRAPSRHRRGGQRLRLRLRLHAGLRAWPRRSRTTPTT